MARLRPPSHPPLPTVAALPESVRPEPVEACPEGTRRGPPARVIPALAGIQRGGGGGAPPSPPTGAHTPNRPSRRRRPLHNPFPLWGKVGMGEFPGVLPPFPDRRRVPTVGATLVVALPPLPTLTRPHCPHSDAPATLPPWNTHPRPCNRKSLPPPRHGAPRHGAPRSHRPHRRPSAVQPPKAGGCLSRAQILEQSFVAGTNPPATTARRNNLPAPRRNGGDAHRAGEW